MDNSNWIEYNKSWGDFKTDGLSKPGVILEVKEDGINGQSVLHRYLIGGCNEQGGRCDCCSISCGTVIRYKVLEINYE